MILCDNEEQAKRAAQTASLFENNHYVVFHYEGKWMVMCGDINVDRWSNYIPNVKTFKSITIAQYYRGKRC